MPFLQINGHRIHYREQGSGTLLLILPGNTASSALHMDELKYFGQWYRTICPDFWGTGLSERISGGWQDDWFDQAAYDCLELIRQLGEDSALVMGTSGGAIVAWLMALQNPQPVQALVIDSQAPVFPAGWLERNISMRNPAEAGAAAFWQAAHGEDWRAVVEADSSFLLRYARRNHAAFKAQIEQIRLPVFLSASLCDALLPPDTAMQLFEIAQAIPGCQLLLYNGGSHPLMWSEPELFRAVTRRFLSSLG